MKNFIDNIQYIKDCLPKKYNKQIDKFIENQRIQEAIELCCDNGKKSTIELDANKLYDDFCGVN